MPADPFSTLVVASLAPTPRVWSYADDPADAIKKAVEANQYEFQHQQPGVRPRNWAMMTETAYRTAERTHYLSEPLKEITAERFHEMLEILPPVVWQHRDGVERFMVSEALSGTYHSQFATCHGRYFEGVVDAADQSTWITGAKIARQLAADGFASKEGGRPAGKGRAV